MIFILTLLILTSLLLVFWRTRQKQWRGAALLAAMTFCLWAGFGVDYYSSRHWIAVGFPINLAQANVESVLSFELPKGEYRVVAEILKTNDQGKEAGLEYSVDLPGQNFFLKKQETLNFHLGLSQIRMDSFKIFNHRSQGKLTAKIIKPGNGHILLKIVTDRYWDM